MDKKVFGIGGMLGMLAGIATYFYINASSYIEFQHHYNLLNLHIERTPSFVFFSFALLGMIVGRLSEKCRTVNLAFMIGGASFFLITTILLSIWLLYEHFTLEYGIRFVPNFYFSSFFIVFSICTGSLACGISAIQIRDYHQSQRVRFMPQFTLYELMIAVTLTAVILGCIMSIKILHE